MIRERPPLATAKFSRLSAAARHTQRAEVTGHGFLSASLSPVPGRGREARLP